MNITERSSKAELITAALELTDLQASQINALQQRQALLLALLGGVCGLALVWG